MGKGRGVGLTYPFLSSEARLCGVTENSRRLPRALAFWNQKGRDLRRALRSGCSHQTKAWIMSVPVQEGSKIRRVVSDLPSHFLIGGANPLPPPLVESPVAHAQQWGGSFGAERGFVVGRHL